MTDRVFVIAVKDKSCERWEKIAKTRFGVHARLRGINPVRVQLHAKNQSTGLFLRPYGMRTVFRSRIILPAGSEPRFAPFGS